MTSILVGPGSGDSGGPGRARGGTHTGSRGLGFRGIVEEHLEGALRARDHDPVRADGLDLSWAHSVPYGIAEHPLDQGVFEVGAAPRAVEDHAVQDRPAGRLGGRDHGRFGATRVEEAPRGNHAVRAEVGGQAAVRHGCRAGRGRGLRGPRRGGRGKRPRDEELARERDGEDEPEGRDGDGEQDNAPRQRYSFPGTAGLSSALVGGPGRTYPDTVSVVSRSRAWPTATTRMFMSRRVRSLGVCSSKWSSATISRTLPATAISIGTSCRPAKSTGGKTRSLRTSTFALSATSLTSFCSSDAASGAVDPGSRRADSASSRLASAARAWPRAPARAGRARRCGSSLARPPTGTRRRGWRRPHPPRSANAPSARWWRSE